MSDSQIHIRRQIAIALLSIALIAFQLVLMQILSIVQWYHFAYMVISVALLGFGASGTLIAVARKWLLDRFELLLPLLMIGTGISITIVVRLSQMPFARFDSYLLFVDNTHIGSLLISYFFFFVPFFLGALAIGLIFVRDTQRIGVYYFANLFGSGLGGLLAIILLWIVRPDQLAPLTAFFALLAGIFVLPSQFRKTLLFVVSIGLFLSVQSFVYPPALYSSEYKDASYALQLPDATIRLERSSPRGLVQVIHSPAFRQAPGLSLNYTGLVPIQHAVFINGDARGTVMPWSRTDSTHILDYTTSALPYATGTYDNVLVLDAGTGTAVGHALTRGARHVVAIEPQEVLVTLLSSEWSAITDSLVHHPAVDIKVLEPRTYLSSGTSTFDLIFLPVVGSFGGAAGVAALREEYSLTRDAFQDMWNRLSPEGVITISAWMDYPYRRPLKILATLVEVLEDNGIQKPSEHIASVRSWGTITFLLTRTPLTTRDTDNIRSFAESMSFDPALLPDLDSTETMLNNRMQDASFFTYLQQIVSPDRDSFYDRYDFRVTPVTDNRPYFSQFLKWQRLRDIRAYAGDSGFPFLELGSLIVIITLLQILLIAPFLIVLPLFRLGWQGSLRFWTIAYYGAIGLGYMFVEIVFIQRFTLYFGHPLYAAAAVIAAILIFSGFGSYLSDRFVIKKRTLGKVTGVIVLLVLIYSFALTPLLRITIAFPPVLKIFTAFFLIAPPALLMGIPFPIGLRYLSRHNPTLVPWAWGINGCLSVISTVLATIIAVYVGFLAVMLFAAAFYGLAAFACLTVLSKGSNRGLTVPDTA